MKKLIIKTAVEVYDQPGELPKEDATVLEAAKRALDKSYSPYSSFKVGAGLLLDNGEILEGANFENASYPLCLCAERVALAAAASLHSDVLIKTLAVTVMNPRQKLSQPISPCGACRQFICEVEYKQKAPIRIILQGELGEIFVLPSGTSLLPFHFDGSFL